MHPTDAATRDDALLAGVRVVDFSRYLPGPFATLQLAQLGAQVTTVEQPPGGDPMRQVPPLGPDGESLASASLSRGKTQLLADLADDAAREQVLALCDQADVVVESFRPGVAARLGIGPEQLRARKPALVYCSISGYGQTGPWAQTAGHDANYESIAGLLDANGTAERPVLPAVPLADLAGGSFAATGICAALVRRARTGQGAYLDISLTEAAIAFQPHTLPAMGTPFAERERGLLTGGLACFRVYECRDGRHVAIAAIEPKFFQRVCELAGVPELAARQYELDTQAQLAEQLGAALRTRDAHEWHELMATDETCATMLLREDEVAAHPQVAARGAVEHLHGDSSLLAPASPFVVDGRRT